MGALFGPAGKSDSFATMGFKKTADIPQYIEQCGLDVFEYQCGRGVRLSEKDGKILDEGFKSRGIKVTLHAPYYISLSGTDEEKRLNSIKYITDSAEAVLRMSGDRIVVHSGSAGKITRQEALALACDTLARARAALIEQGQGDVHICPETMGKVNQLGNLDEVMELCKVDESFIPCIDFGHLNARTLGGIKDKNDYKKIFDTMENALGFDRTAVFHSHFSKIMYTDPGGEKMHLNFDDTLYGPDFEPMLEEVARRGYSPIIICESAGLQSEDALIMKKYYGGLL